MDKQTGGQAGAKAIPTEPEAPGTSPDVAGRSSPSRQDGPDAARGVLQEALPEITEAARKVGGFKKLSDIAGQLGEADAGH